MYDDMLHVTILLQNQSRTNMASTVTAHFIFFFTLRLTAPDLLPGVPAPPAFATVNLVIVVHADFGFNVFRSTSTSFLSLSISFRSSANSAATSFDCCICCSANLSSLRNTFFSCFKASRVLSAASISDRSMGDGPRIAILARCGRIHGRPSKSGGGGGTIIRRKGNIGGGTGASENASMSLAILFSYGMM